MEATRHCAGDAGTRTHLFEVVYRRGLSRITSITVTMTMTLLEIFVVQCPSGELVEVRLAHTRWAVERDDQRRTVLARHSRLRVEEVTDGIREHPYGWLLPDEVLIQVGLESTARRRVEGVVAEECGDNPDDRHGRSPPELGHRRQHGYKDSPVPVPVPVPATTNQSRPLRSNSLPTNAEPRKCANLS